MNPRDMLLAPVVATGLVLGGCSTETIPAPQQSFTPETVAQFEAQLSNAYPSCEITDVKNANTATTLFGYLAGTVEVTVDAPRNPTVDNDKNNAVSYVEPTARLANSYTGAAIY